MVIFCFLMLFSVWTFTKIPFFLAYSPLVDLNREGVEGSVNLVHWIHGNGGYHGHKLKSPVANFFLIHMMFGITVSVMVALPLLNSQWRRDYGYVTFIFTLLLGLHTLPAALQNDWRIIFTLACLYMIITAICGLVTLCLNDNNDETRLKNLYYAIAVGPLAAFLAEFGLGIIPNIWKRVTNGVWPPSDFVGPNPSAGHTAYDVLPEWVGYMVFFILVICFWVVWPMRLLSFDTTAPVVPEEPGACDIRPESVGYTEFCILVAVVCILVAVVWVIRLKCCREVDTTAIGDTTATAGTGMPGGTRAPVVPEEPGEPEEPVVLEEPGEPEEPVVPEEPVDPVATETQPLLA